LAALAGHHALVTGGGRGIGRATARALTQAGAVVTIVGRTEASLKDAVARRRRRLRGR
jgi:NAD(P)-dependent dehydrogenase (short-subunit alcohol dehydrogenase family)